MSCWTSARDAVESVGVAIGDYLLPGSGMLTSKLVSQGAQADLNSPLGMLATTGASIAGGVSGNLGNYGSLASSALNAVGVDPTTLGLTGTGAPTTDGSGVNLNSPGIDIDSQPNAGTPNASPNAEPGTPGAAPIQDVVNGGSAVNPDATVTGSTSPPGSTPGYGTNPYNSLTTPQGGLLSTSNLSLVPDPTQSTTVGTGTQIITPNPPSQSWSDAILKSPFTPLAAAAVGGVGTEEAKLKSQQLQYQQLLDQQAQHNTAIKGVVMPGVNVPVTMPAGGLLSTTMPPVSTPAYG